MNPTSSASPEAPVELFRYLRTLVDTAEQSRMPFPKFALVEAYWHIGRILVEIEQQGQERAEYGLHLIETLSAQLTDAFGKGYSLPNMWRFKQFYLAFQNLSTNGRENINLRNYLRTELSWSHYRALMQLKNKEERAFYLQTAADEQWTVRFLQRMIRSRYYYQAALGEDQLLPGPADFPARTGGPSPTLSARHASPRSRLAVMKKLLLERYVGYAFVAQRQFVSVAGQDRWAELVFFHYVLNRFVLVQLGEHDSHSQATFRQLLDAYQLRQPPGHPSLPVGLLVDQKGRVRSVTSSHEIALPPGVASHFPQELP